jgi:Protein of unknown function (DUF3363)
MRELRDALTQSEVERAIQVIASRAGQVGLARRPVRPGEIVSGLHHQRIDFAVGRFAILGADVGFERAPWKPELKQFLGKTRNGIALPRGGIQGELGLGLGIGQ